MIIEINNDDLKRVSKLLLKFLELNEKSNYDFLDKSTLHIGHNNKSDFSFIYIEDNPSLSLCLDKKDDIVILYTSGLDGLEFIKYAISHISSLSDLEEEMNKSYTLEEKIRLDDYENKETTKKFIEAMIINRWVKIEE